MFIRAHQFSLLIVFLLFAFFNVTLKAQTYPSALVTNFTGPRTLFLDEYSNPFQPKIRTTVFFTDFTETSWQFSLRVKITGPNGILIQTKVGARPVTPLLVSPGQPYILEGADLSFYFNYDNLTFSGISRSQLEVNNRLPEGLYTFCFEAVDYESSKSLSLPSCATAYLSLNDPAIVISPMPGSVIENISMQNILFQWQLSNANGNLDLSQLNYQIDLYEVNNNWTNPTNAILNNQALPIWQSQILTQNNYLYSITDPPLIKGRRYVFTITTRQNNGRSSFKNNGVSMPCYFHYGYFENDTIDIIKPLDEFQFALSTPSQFKWKRPRKAISGQLVSYTLKLVELQNNQDPETAILNNSVFYQQEYLPVNDAVTEKTIPVMFWMNVKRMGNYAWQVSAKSGSQIVAKSEVMRFTGPPAIENFIAGGFLMTVLKLDYYDTINKVISGLCKTRLTADPGKENEFKYKNISITSIGNNEWVMIGGEIGDKLHNLNYTLTPQSFPENKNALFKADSVFVNTAGLKLSGKVEWKFPHPGTSQQVEKIISKRSLLTLANASFVLNNNQVITLSEDYNISVMEPFGFNIKINQSSGLNIYQSQYEFNFSGFVQTPGNGSGVSNTRVNVAFENTNQLHYIEQEENSNSEDIFLAQKTHISFLPTNYILDFSERQSPGEFSGDSSWKGVFIQKGNLNFPKLAETSGQIALPMARTFSFTNLISDTNRAFITHRGLFFTGTFPFLGTDSVKFNTFSSKLGHFYIRMNESEIVRSHLSGGIFIPVIDTINSFPYFVELTDFGFNEGYLLNGLANQSFTFNALGGAEQKIPIQIKRAVFKGKNRLEMDLDLSWPYFDLHIQNVQRFSVWGNGNIGFDVPNGKAALTYQAQGKASNFDITVDYLGCGRNGNAYAFGASAKINMDEEISGENGPPVINAYSIYKNPLLAGLIYIPPASTTAIVSGTNSTVANSYQSSTGSYSQALTSGFNDALAQLGYTAGDSVNISLAYNTDPSSQQPLVQGSTIVQIRQLVDIILRLKPFIKTDAISTRDWQILEKFNLALNSDIIPPNQVTNGKELLNFVFNRVLESIIIEVNGSIQQISDNAMSKVRGAINTRVVSPINTKIDESISTIIERLEKKILTQVDEQYHQIVQASFGAVKNNITQGIKNSLANSFEINITSKLTNFVQLGVTSKVKQFVSAEVTIAGRKLIDEGAQANFNLQNLLQNSGTLFADIADTVKDVIVNTNAANFMNTAESLVNDAIAGINWTNISNQILAELIQRGLSEGIANGLAATVGNSAGPYVNAVLSTVKFDFTNLGEKLKNGEFDKIVSFDPTTIYLETPAVDIRGTLIFKKDDPLFGDSWQADVLVRVKVPKKDNPVECTAFFLNGKTTQLSQNFTYWYAKLGVMGLNIPLSPAPIIWDGAEGYAFSKMKKTAATTLIPDNTNKFGVGCKFFFYDQSTSGKTFLFGLGAEADFNDAGFVIQLVGDASVLNFQKNAGGKYVAPGFVTGTGVLGYYKTPECSKIAGNFTVKLNTEPIICAGGDVGIDLKSANDWKAWVGTQQNPIGVKILCKDFLSNTAFMQVSNTGFSTGLGMNVALSAKSGWLNFSQISVRGTTALNFGYNAYTSIEWDPTFKINEATLSAWASAAIGIEYQTPVNTGSITLAGVSLAGSLTYKSNPEAELHGAMNGNITVLNYNLGFNTPVHYSLSKQKILD